MTNKKFKLAAMSLATAVAVSSVGPSASAVTYYLGNGDIKLLTRMRLAARTVIRVRTAVRRTAPTSTRIKRKLAMVRSTSRTAMRQK